MIYFSSDHHFYHQNIISFCNRPFTSTEEMNETLINNWNSVVKSDDTVYYLGDFSLAFRPIELFSHKLNGTKYLVPGNHDFCHSYNKKSRNPENRQKWIQKYEECGWVLLPEQTTLDLSDIGIVNLCHLPYANADVSRHEDKYEQWRPIDDDRWLIHGHTHSKEKMKSRNIHVGVDAWNYYPVSIDDVINLIKGK